MDIYDPVFISKCVLANSRGFIALAVAGLWVDVGLTSSLITFWNERFMVLSGYRCLLRLVAGFFSKLWWLSNATMFGMLIYVVS